MLPPELPATESKNKRLKHALRQTILQRQNFYAPGDRPLFTQHFSQFSSVFTRFCVTLQWTSPTSRYSQQSYLLLFGILSPTHSFTPGLKPSFSANPSHCSPSFLLLKYSLRGFPGLFTVISEHICFLLLVLVFLFLHFLVVGSVR